MVLAGLVVLSAPLLAARGGSNFGFYDITGCHRSDFGVLKQYNEKTHPVAYAAINDALVDMYNAGQRRLRIPVFHSTNSVQNRNGSVIPHGNGAENAYGNNMRALLKKLDALGYHSVIVGSFPVSSSEPETWTGWNLNNPTADSRYQANKALVFNMYRWVADTVNKYNLGISFKIDLRNEGAPNQWTHPHKLVYAQTLWQDFLAEFNNAGRANSLGFSVAASMPNGQFGGIRSQIDHFQIIYGSQPPYLFDYHIYGSDLGSPGSTQPNDADEYAKLVEIDRYMSSKGYGQGLIVGETYYNDTESADNLADAIAAISRPVFYVLQWPRTRANPQGCSQVDTAPPVAYDQMINAGL
ncbi:MAG: hypothetical protein Tsb002_27730 [Wenzhouxiangellaceae bacterium]